jgi:hypothetical protein
MVEGQHDDGCVYELVSQRQIDCVALHKRYYRMWGKHLSCEKLQAHIAKLRKCKPFWQLVGSQAVQDICQRIENFGGIEPRSIVAPIPLPLTAKRFAL